MNVLIVEDDQTSRLLLGFQAEDTDLPVDVATAGDGEEGLARMIRAPRIGLVLLDLGMPRMDGFEFLRRMRKLQDHLQTPVIVVTAADLSHVDHGRLSALGVIKIFQKGRYDTKALTDAITLSMA